MQSECSADLLIVDTNEVTGKLLKRNLAEHSRFRSVQIAADLPGAERLLEPLAALPILLNMDSLSSLKLSEVTSFRKRFPNLLIVLITWLDPVYYRRAIKAAGADEIFSFQDLPDALTTFFSTGRSQLAPQTEAPEPAACCNHNKLPLQTPEST